MTLISQSWVIDIFIVVITATIVIYINFIYNTRKYWIRRNFPSETPRFIFGNAREANVTKRVSDVLDELYFRNKENKITGIWLYVKPVLLVSDLELTKNILVRNFSSFHDRGIVLHEDLEPLMAHLFNVSGEQWRKLRVKMAPTFTTGKMKLMFETMLDVAKHLQEHIQVQNTGEPIEVRELMACFTTDVITSCAFGVEANSLRNANAEFRKYGRKIFASNPLTVLAVVMNFVAPKLQRLLRLKQIPQETTDFILKTVEDVINYREKNEIVRKDFMSLLIELKNKGRIDDVDSKSPAEELETDGTDEPFTVVQAAAQAFVFFFAGFETSASTITNTLYEIAVNRKCQQKLQNEVDKIDGKISYNTIQEMQYLDWTIQETLRKYPPVPMTLRECTKTYAVPGTNWVVEKGDSIVIPISAIHNDPEYFTDPEKYDPGRFSPENRSQRDPILNLGFGAGPRICIGARFGQLQVKVALVAILSKYNVELCEQTTVPIKFDPRNFFPVPLGGLYLKFSSRAQH